METNKNDLSDMLQNDEQVVAKQVEAILKKNWEDAENLGKFDMNGKEVKKEDK
jgi:hypothetical protein